MDLQSAYDNVRLNGLLFKMIKDVELDGNAIAWVKDYMTGRLNRVVYNGYVTEWRNGLENLLQGSTLSTILFIADFPSFFTS